MQPDFIRTLDPRGRLVLPAPVAVALGSTVRVSATLTGSLLVRRAAVGSRVRSDGTTRRLTLPAELRASVGLRGGRDAGLALVPEGLAVWPLPETPAAPLPEGLVSAFLALLAVSPIRGDWRERFLRAGSPAEGLAVIHGLVNRLFARGRERECWAEVRAVEGELARDSVICSNSYCRK